MQNVYLGFVIVLVLNGLYQKPNHFVDASMHFDSDFIKWAYLGKKILFNELIHHATVDNIWVVHQWYNLKHSMKTRFINRQPRSQGLMISAPFALPLRQSGRATEVDIIRPWERGWLIACNDREDLDNVNILYLESKMSINWIYIG